MPTQPIPTLTSAEIYDPATGAWTKTDSLARPRYGARTVTLTDGRILLVGTDGGGLAFERSGGTWGPSGMYELIPDEMALHTAEIYDPRSGRFETGGSFQDGLYDYSVVALADGGALLVGGYGTAVDENDAYVESLPNTAVRRFDPKTGEWTRPAIC